MFARFDAFRQRVKTREAQYGWLFPALAPACAAAVVFATLIIPVIAHWDAVDAIEQSGGHVVMTSGYIPALDLRIAMFAEVRSVKLQGANVDDDLLQYAGNLRGLERLQLHGTRVSDRAIERFQRRCPEVIVTRL